MWVWGLRVILGQHLNRSSPWFAAGEVAEGTGWLTLAHPEGDAQHRSSLVGHKPGAEALSEEEKGSCPGQGQH